MIQRYKDQQFTYLGHGVAEPIGLEYLFSSVKKYGFKPILKNRYEIAIRLPEHGKIISLFSANSPEWQKVLAMNTLAQRNGNITVIGGYHISGVYKEYSSNPFDYTVIGEGEEIINDVIKDILSSILNKKKCKKNYIAKPISKLDSLPFPSRSKKYLNSYKILDLMTPTQSQQISTAIVLASRGCNYQCSFCASGNMWGRGIRLRSPINIVEEIKQLQKGFNTNTIVFIDQALGQNVHWTADLCKEIIKEKLNFKWYLQTNITINRELIPLLAAAGCSKIGFGIEGISPSATKKVKAVNSMSVCQMNDLFSLCNLHGIIVKGYLLLGFPWETPSLINEYYNSIQQIEANVIKISFFTPFPGTEDWKKYKNQLATNNWDDFDTVKMPVVKNPMIGVDEYLTIRKELFHSFYTSHNYSNTTRRLLNMFPYYDQCYSEFFHFLKTFEMLPDNISNEEEWLRNTNIHSLI